MSHYISDDDFFNAYTRESQLAEITKSGYCLKVGDLVRDFQDSYVVTHVIPSNCGGTNAKLIRMESLDGKRFQYAINTTLHLISYWVLYGYDLTGAYLWVQNI